MLERFDPTDTSPTGQVAPDTAVYVISVVAELIGVHAQTLRSYERHGLIDPTRSAGGDRRYSPNDLMRLRRINELSGNGISLGAVKQILDLEDHNQRLCRQLADMQSQIDGLHAAAHPRPVVPQPNDSDLAKG